MSAKAKDPLIHLILSHTVPSFNLGVGEKHGTVYLFHVAQDPARLGVYTSDLHV